jgi:hypothetical protein
VLILIHPPLSVFQQLDSLSMDKLHGIFTAYEMRIEQENPVMKEAKIQGIQEDKEAEQEKVKTILQLQQ